MDGLQDREKEISRNFGFWRFGWWAGELGVWRQVDSRTEKMVGRRRVDSKTKDKDQLGVAGDLGRC